MTFDSSTILAQQQPVAIFSNNPVDAAKKALAKALGQGCSTRHLNDQEDVELCPLILIDCRCYSARRIQSWLAAKSAGHLPPVALYNTRPASLHENLLDWPCVRGFFYRTTATEHVTAGLELLLAGDFWVPRRLLHSYLERNRRNPGHQIKTPKLLTRRERQILSMVENGDTNATIAAAVSLSEHTIKTHLYNIYRKIGVANRVEAINWSRQNLAAHMQD